MKYRLKIADQIEEVDVTYSDGQCTIRCTIGGKEYQVRYQVISDHYFHLVTDGKASEVLIATGEQGKEIFINGKTYLVLDADQQLLRRARSASLEESLGEVTPPMPSVVVRIMVNEKQRVKRGQGLVVVSAMKMETTLRSPYDGLVKKLNTSIGAKVSPGDILVEIEEEVWDNER